MSAKYVHENLGQDHKRFLSNKPMLYESAISAAKEYVANLNDSGVGTRWLYSKPFDPGYGHLEYFRLMFDLLNLLKVMQISPRGKILEIGCGPGWITEILLMLGFSVDAIEPCADLIKIAQDRCNSLESHYHYSSKPKVSFHETTLEEIEFESENFDAIIYFDVLRHVVNEKIAIEKTFRFLQPGGCLGIVEGAWHPDFTGLESALIAEMKKYGTLENPFSIKYLDELLSKNGFIDIQRYVGVNGFFTAGQLSEPLSHFAQPPLVASNNLTARKPSTLENKYPKCSNLKFKTNAIINVLSGSISPLTNQVTLVFELKNSGETLFDNRRSSVGHVTVALRCGMPGTEEFLECSERHLLPEPLAPNKSLKMNVVFTLPALFGDVPGNWSLDLISEGIFWFSSRNCINSCVVSISNSI